jgi:prenyl protein peptidase
LINETADEETVSRATGGGWVVLDLHGREESPPPTRSVAGPLRTLSFQVAFQMLYTTVFGWLATYLFVRTGHLAAPVAAHAFCNWAGFPPFGEMAEHPRGILLMLITAAGVAAFFMSLPKLTSPERYGQDFYAA